MQQSSRAGASETLQRSVSASPHRDALAENESAREVMGEPTLRVIAHELVKVIKSNVAIDWMHRDSARANIRRHVKPAVAQIWISARLAGRGGAERAATGGSAVGGVGVGSPRVSESPLTRPWQRSTVTRRGWERSHEMWVLLRLRHSAVSVGLTNHRIVAHAHFAPSQRRFYRCARQF
jgi:hypothetical protein